MCLQPGPGSARVLESCLGEPDTMANTVAAAMPVYNKEPDVAQAITFGPGFARTSAGPERK
jgi:hypothetical protein